MDFMWDEKERLSNLKDHGVDFLDAALIFRGPILRAEDKRMAYGEIRYRALGNAGGDDLIVSYVWRGTARVILSAWKVNGGGKRRYAQILSGNAHREIRTR